MGAMGAIVVVFLYWHPKPIHVIPYLPKLSKLKRNIESFSRY
jgi:hypothetical protein